MAFMLNLTAKTDLSPKGIIYLIEFLYDAINSPDGRGFLQKVFKNGLKTLCSLMRDNQLLSVQEWPQYSGGGSPAACMIVTHILRILNIPFNLTGYERESETIASDMAKGDIVHLTLNALRYLSVENVPIAISLISRLVFTVECSKNFAQQFVQGGGLAIIAKYKLLSDQNAEQLTVDTLSLVS